MTEPFDKRREDFLSRWSRRKRAEPERRDAEDRRVSEALAAESGVPAAAPEAAPVKVPDDLPPIESLTSASDYGRFMRPDVPLASRSAAMKKLFADPHFNVMDGLDTYIDDYTRPDPIPVTMLRDLAQSRMLRLFGDEPEEHAAGAASPAVGQAPGQGGPDTSAAESRAPERAEVAPVIGESAGTASAQPAGIPAVGLPPGAQGVG